MRALAPGALVLALLGFGLLGFGALACGRAAVLGDLPEDAASPQAQAVPAPLANAQISPSSRPDPESPDAGPPAVSLRADDLLTDTLIAKDVGGFALEASFRHGEVPPLASGREVNGAGLEAARRKTEPRLSIELTPARLRLVPLGSGFPLPRELELRARSDRLGHVAVLGGRYRALAPGTLRALLGERRLDVGPIAYAELTPKGDGPKRLGMRTRRVEVTTRAAKATVEIARVQDLGEGGVLLCRFLLDLINAPPRTPLCSGDEVPLFAELRWSTRGGLGFEVHALARHTDLSPVALAAPPPHAVRAMDLLPRDRGGRFLGPLELRAIRHGPPDNAGATLELSNPTNELATAWIDGVPAVWLGPSAQFTIDGLYPGRYQLAWRTFLGDTILPVETIVVPGKATWGSLDAGR